MPPKNEALRHPYFFMITSTANKQMKNLLLLQKKAKARKEQQVFLAEGRKMFEEAPRELIKKVYVSETFLRGETYEKQLFGIEYEVVKDSVFASVSDTMTPQGILCVVSMPVWDIKSLMGQKQGLFLLLENIQDPGNLGTMLRVGEGAGVTAVIADKTTVDLYNPKTIRSTMGSIYRVPFAAAEDFSGAVRELKEHGVNIFAAHLKGSVTYEQGDYRGSAGFLIGNEGNGLTREAAGLSDTYIRIPMEGQVESLNAAVAAGILLYEAKRQRKE